MEKFPSAHPAALKFVSTPRPAPVSFGTLAAKQADPNYLMDELPKRIAQRPVTFRLPAQVTNEGDPVNDPTAVWLADRKLISLGTISLTGKGARIR